MSIFYTLHFNCDLSISQIASRLKDHLGFEEEPEVMKSNLLRIDLPDLGVDISLSLDERIIPIQDLRMVYSKCCMLHLAKGERYTLARNTMLNAAKVIQKLSAGRFALFFNGDVLVMLGIGSDCHVLGLSDPHWVEAVNEVFGD